MALETISEAHRRLAAAGFVADLTAVDGRLRSAGDGAEYDPSTLLAAEIARFEGVSDPDDEAVLVAVATRDHVPIGTFTVPYGPATSPAETEVLEHLHRIVVDDAELDAHDAHDHVVAIVDGREAAEAVVAELREVGLGSEHLGLAVRRGDSMVFEHDEDADLGHDLEAGVGAGAIVGFVAGVLLFGVTVPGLGALGAGGLVALGAGSGMGGAMLGGLLGVGAASEEFDSHRRLRELHLSGDEVLIVVCGHEHTDLVESAVARHGGRLL